MALEKNPYGIYITPESPYVVMGHKFCKTREAKWLCLPDIYEKLQRPNFYDIGGTYIEDIPDYWFVYKTEQIADITLLHLFMWNRHEENVLSIAASDSSDMLVDKRNDSVFLPRSFKQFHFEDVKEISKLYITTYCFKDVDVEALKCRTLYIAISFKWNNPEGMHKQIAEMIWYNHDFGALLKDPVASDFIIESADCHQFKVHKTLLAANSEVFKAMFRDEMAESQNGYVKLIDVNKDDFQNVLEFIYTGTIEDIEDSNFFNLLQLADRFNLRGLLKFSQYVLSQQLNMDNALETLIIADMYNANALKIAAMKIIKKNNSIIKTDMFKEIKNVELLREMCEYLMPSQ